MVDGPLPPLPSDERTADSRGRPLVRARTLWMLAALAMVLDIALTGLGLSMGLAERNRVARLFISEFGLLGAGVLLKGFALAVGYVAWRVLPHLDANGDRHRYVVPLGLALPSWGAVGVNTVTILAVS